MEILPPWAPGFHPLIIHFPIALLTLAIGLTVLALFYVRSWLKNATAGLYVLGTLGALVAYISGRSAADSIGLNLKAEVAISTHSNWGQYTLLYFTALTIIYYLLTIVLKKNKIAFRAILAVLALGGFYILAKTAEYGGRLVFEYGLGVQH